VKQILDYFKAAKEQVNPAIRLQRHLLKRELAGQLTVSELVDWRGKIEAAINRGSAEARLIDKALDELQQSPAVASQRVPEGF